MLDIEPVNALGFFIVSPRLDIFQIIVYEYIDIERRYFSLVEDIDELDNELEELAKIMQDFLDEEEVIINDERVRPRVIGVDIGFRGEPEEPFITYFIYFKGKPRRGLNYYENIYEADIAEYPISAYWYFPPRSKVKSVEASGDIEIIGDRIVIMRLAEGDRVNGYEKIVFELIG